MNIKNNSLVNYIKESYSEMKKVNWPTKQETIRITVVVIVISILLAIFLGLLDYIFSLGIEQAIINFR